VFPAPSYLPTYLIIYLSTYLSIYLAICLSIYLPRCRGLRPHLPACNSRFVFGFVFYILAFEIGTLDLIWFAFVSWVSILMGRRGY